MTTVNVTKLRARLAFLAQQAAIESRLQTGPLKQELIRAGLQLGHSARTLHQDPKAAAAFATVAVELIARAAVTRAFTPKETS